MSFKRFNGIPHPHIYAALVPAEDGVGLPGFDLLMPKKEFTVGRAEHNDICIRGAGISDEHCKLVWNTEKKRMYVQWLPTTNGTWILRTRYDCHRLKEGELYPLLGGEISFGPSVNKYGKPPGPDDYMYSFRVYSEHEMEDYLEPAQLAERRKARSRFGTARSDESATKCVITYRSLSDRAPDPSLPRQVTPPFVPPPRLGRDFRVTGNVGHYQGRESDRPDSFDRANPDIVWRGFVPIKPGTESLVPREVELWSNHYGLPVGLHPKYSQYSSVPYDDVQTDFDRERLEQREYMVDYLRSAERKAAYKAECERDGRTYFSPTPSPSPAPESVPDQHSGGDEAHAASSLADEATLAATPTAHTCTPPRKQSSLDCAPDTTTSGAGPSSILSRTSVRTHNIPGKRKRDLDPPTHEHSAKRHQPRATRDGARTRQRTTRAKPGAAGMVVSDARGPRTADAELGEAQGTPPRRSARLVGKPPVRYKY